MNEQTAEALCEYIERDTGIPGSAELIEQEDGTFTVWLSFAGLDEFYSQAEYVQWRDGMMDEQTSDFEGTSVGRDYR